MQQLTIKDCDQDDTECLSELLETEGALSITMTDQYDSPILEPEPGTVPLWPRVLLQALFPEPVDVDNVISTIQLKYPHLVFSTEILPEQEWEKACLVDFQPKRFGNNLWICPSWHTPPDAHAVNVTLDPGLAFGTGAHHTTALCLSWLERASLDGKTVIDYGCGSGILSIAALKLGARHVQAVDIDPQALLATQNNAKTNHIDPKQLIIDSPEYLAQADIIIANILLTPLMVLKDKFHTLLNTNGTLVLSGILLSQLHELVEHYQSHFECIMTESDDNWGLLVFKKKSSQD